MDLIDAIKAIDKPHEDDVLNRLFTPWGEKLDKDRFRRDMGGVEEAYEEVMRRLSEKA